MVRDDAERELQIEMGRMPADVLARYIGTHMLEHAETEIAECTDLVESTLPMVFNRAGYDTMRTCKKGNSYAAANAQFTVVRDAAPSSKCSR